MANDDDQERVRRLRRALEEGRHLARLEEERAMLGMEIVESLLLRIEQLQERVARLEGHLPQFDS